MLVGLKVHVTPLGADAENWTFPLKPFTGDSVTVAVPEAPLLKLSEEVLMDSAMSGVTTTYGLNVKVAVAVRVGYPLLVPVIVTE